ncbi:MAG: septum formation initiator family protein [Planctomycetota bacterium]|nr:septum formation initiator family protein [Planctomycetota bacterium]
MTPTASRCAPLAGPRGDKFIVVGSFCFWLLVFGGVLIFLLATTAAAHSKNKRLEGELSTLESEIETLEDENVRLAAEREALRTDPVYVEKILRDEFKLVAPSERVVVPD